MIYNIPWWPKNRLMAVKSSWGRLLSHALSLIHIVGSLKSFVDGIEFLTVFKKMFWNQCEIKKIFFILKEYFNWIQNLGGLADIRSRKLCGWRRVNVWNSESSCNFIFKLLLNGFADSFIDEKYVALFKAFLRI